jgi:hypothetical protein
MLGTIEVSISWAALAVFVALMGLWVSSQGVLLWKFVQHTNNNERHTSGKVIAKDICDSLHDGQNEKIINIKNDLTGLKGYIADVDSRAAKAVEGLRKEVNETNKLLVQFMAENKK